MLDGFLTSLADLHIPVFVVPGNHDSAERLGFGSHLLRESGVYIAAPYHGAVERFTLEDAYGPVGIHLLPFCGQRQWGPATRKKRWTATTAECAWPSPTLIFPVQTAMCWWPTSLSPAAARSRSAAIPKPLPWGGWTMWRSPPSHRFDYVALGHIHGPQFVGRPSVRYAGSPLKYSFSEWRQQKTALLVT